MKNRSKAELKALETAPYLTHVDGTVYDITGKVQGVDYEINGKSLVTTNPKEIKHIHNIRSTIIPLTEAEDPEYVLSVRRKAQAASTKVKKERKNLVDICNTIFSLPASDLAKTVVQNGDLAERLKATDTGLTLYDLMVAKMCEEALSGNVRAFAEIRDSAGDKPVQKQEIKADVVSEQDMELVRNVQARLDAMNTKTE